GSVQQITGDMPIPGPQVGGIQRQLQALLAVLQGQFLLDLTGDVADGQDQAGLAVERDLIAIDQVGADALILVAQTNVDRCQGSAIKVFQQACAILCINPNTQIQCGTSDDFIFAPAGLLLEAAIDLEVASGVALCDD